MRIQLNGELRDLPGPVTVDALLDLLGIDARMVAVEVNRLVVRRQAYATTTVPDGAEVEVVAFVGGGSGALS